MTAWKRRRFTQSTGLIAVSLLAVAAARCAPPFPLFLPPLVPVNAPLAPVKAGERFAPSIPSAAFLADEPLPPRSTGTHIVAKLTRLDGSRLIAVWGDPTLWEGSGTEWKPATIPPLPSDAQIVSLSEENGRVQVDTRNAGQLVLKNGTWTPLPALDTPVNANAQALQAYRGILYVATLNDGLVLRDQNGRWQQIAPPQISTNAPRQFILWHDDLYVRHGNGQVDCFNGRAWNRDVFSRLPRRQVSAMATDGKTLFLSQWGGWSETTNGTAFVHRFPPELKNVPTTCLLPTNEKLYIGTQGRGIAEADHESGEVHGFCDERQGLGEDWITNLAQSPTGGILGGTFVGGAYFQFAGWRPLRTTENDCITAMCTTPTAVYLCLRRNGLLRWQDGMLSTVSSQPEAQCVWVDHANRVLWVGRRSAIDTVSLVAQKP